MSSMIITRFRLFLQSQYFWESVELSYLNPVQRNNQTEYKTIPILLVAVLFTFAFGWFAVRAYYDIDNPSIIVAGEAVDQLTPKNAKVIAIYNGDTSFFIKQKEKVGPVLRKVCRKCSDGSGLFSFGQSDSGRHSLGDIV